MKQNADLTVDQLRAENARLSALLMQKDNTIETLRHQLHLFRHARFGRKSEKGAVQEQLALQFDEAVPSPEEEPVAEHTPPETVTYTRRKKGTGRKALPASLPYVEQVHDLNEEDKHCACGCELTHIGDDITEQLDTVPQMTFRVVHIRKKYACKGCEETIQTAALPKQPIPQSIASPGVLAAVINAKFNHHMPLYRQEMMFKEAGVEVSRATLCNWVVKSADLLRPLVRLMEANIQEHDIAYADETPVQVLQQKDRPPASKAYMWLFIGGPPDKRCYVYQYHPSRMQQIPAEFFEDFKGYLHADCYSAYIALGKTDAITHVACMAHARRYFVDVTKLAGKKKGIANQVLTYFAKLYQLEASLKENNATTQEVYQARQDTAKPILKQMKTFLDEKRANILPKTPLGKAVYYLYSHWEALTQYLHDGRLEIDNNRTERSIKPFVIGRKNWLFHGNEKGASSAAILYSLIETCKNHNVDAFAWLKYALSHIQSAQTIEQLEAILPFNLPTDSIQSMRRVPALIFPEKSGVN